MSVWDTRYPEHVAVRRSVNGGLVHVCFSVTPGMAVSYRARIRLSFTNTRGIQYSPYVNPCVSPYRVLNLTLGTKYKYTNEH